MLVMSASTSGRSILGLSTLPRSPPVHVDDQHLDALGDVPRHGGGALARLVVGVRVHGHETQLLCHLRSSSVPGRPARPDRSPDGLCAAGAVPPPCGPVPGCEDGLCHSGRSHRQQPQERSPVTETHATTAVFPPGRYGRRRDGRRRRWVPMLVAVAVLGAVAVLARGRSSTASTATRRTTPRSSVTPTSPTPRC